MTMCKTVNYLSKNIFGLYFVKSFLLFNILKQISSICILHYHQEVFFAFKNLIESNYV